MTPRRLGLLVMAVALLAVLVMSGLRPHLVTGTAQATPIPGPPGVGDCVTDPVKRPTVAAGGSASLIQVYPRQKIGPCNGLRYGEITRVISDPSPVVVEGTATYQSISDPNINVCYDSNSAYLGQATQPIFGLWSPTGTAVAWPALSRPSPRQEAAGQHWLACVVSVLPNVIASTNSDAAPYTESLRHALQNGHNRNLIGYCIKTAAWDQGSESGACGLPHVLEIFAGGFTGQHSATRAELEASCLRVVRELTGIADPTADGGLSVQLYAATSDSAQVSGAQIPAEASLQCGVVTTGGRQLKGSLLALGTLPIPWA
ncbi:hypothetical protein ABIB25_003336 [Nakamurella sp. UYEF19]|uniref:hypothetical protein n=1 Tax=Nakamurella sp. UYEF19 TaxID=1756392 RepID=UPI003394F024